MREEIIVSGRMNPNIDPHLHIWHWQIPLYLFLGGLAAGLLFFVALFVIQGKEDKYPTATKLATLVVPFLLVLGQGGGAWTLMVITPLSVIWAALNIRLVFPNWKWPFKWLDQLEVFFNKYKKVLAWVTIFYALILGVYTGILFSAFNARPLWNTSVLGPLFLTSGLSSGAALIIIMSKNHEERLAFAKIDLLLIGIELFLIVHMFMGFLASTQVQIDAANLFLGGQYTAPFWVFVVFLGLVLPAILEIMELLKIKIPALIPALLVLMGGIILRFIISNAGQLSRWLY